MFLTGLKFNAGAFMFTMAGAYLQDDQLTSILMSNDKYMELRAFFVEFKGNEPHGGLAPAAHPPAWRIPSAVIGLKEFSWNERWVASAMSLAVKISPKTDAPRPMRPAQRALAYLFSRD